MIFKAFYMGFNWVKTRFDALMFRFEWRKKNSHNSTKAKSQFPDVVKVGNATYGPINIKLFGNPDESLTIGNYCSIAEEVVFLPGGNHPINTFSQFPFDAYFNTGVHHQAPTKGPIVVEDDVWIGYGATILSGVTIGQGAIIGAKSVVAKDVPPYAIYVGNKVIKYRYPEHIVEKMKKFDFSKLTADEIIKNRSLFDAEIDETFFETEFYISHLKD